MELDDDVIFKLQETFQDAARHQLETLSAILDRNSRVSYLQSYLRGYDAPINAASFRRAVPLSCHDDYVDHISKLADGILTDGDGQPLLSADPLLCFFCNSGTRTGKPKIVPHFDSEGARAAVSLAMGGSVASHRRIVPPRFPVNKVLAFIYAGNVALTKGGYKAMAASSSPFHNNNSNLSSHFLSIYTSPKEVILGTDVNQQVYCHLLCGLRHFGSIDGILSFYASGLIMALSVLEAKWEKFCEDLDEGIPSSEITDAAMRQSVIDTLGGPQPDLSKRVRAICGETSWEGIVPKLWPNARYVNCVTTGSMVQYYPKLKYYAGEVPMLGGHYFASECCVAINLDLLQPPELTRYVILPTAAYFEFLPFDGERCCVRDDGETVDLSGIEVGKMYELVVTTYGGMYRLRLGDVIRVAGFHKSAPLIEFVMRAPDSAGDMITEKDLLSAMAHFQVESGVEVVEFGSFMDLGLESKQLKIFVEVRDEGEVMQKDGMLRECFSAAEECLGSMYMVMKGRGDVRPLVVCIVKSGTFDGLLHKAIRNGASASQYKPPKIIRNRTIVDYLEASTLLTLSL